MFQRPHPTQFKQHVAEFFDERVNYDEEGEFHPRIAQRLVEYARLQPGQKILDIATGTGLAAIAAAQQVAPDGWVVGVDLSEGMLSQAKRKIEAFKLFNISLHLTDAETLWNLEIISWTTIEELEAEFCNSIHRENRLFQA